MRQGFKNTSIAQEALIAAGDVAYTWDLVTDDIHWVGDLHRLFGEDAARVLATGEAFIARVHDDDLASRLRVLEVNGQRDGHYECEYRIRRDQRAFSWVQEKGRVEVDGNGLPVRLTGLLRIAANRAQKENLLRHFSNFDDLTGYVNKTRLRSILENTLAYSRRFNVQGAFIQIAIDRLARVNEVYGRDVADSAIVQVGEVIENMVRSIDTVGRLEGDQFGMVAANCNAAETECLLDRLLAAFRGRQIKVDGTALALTVSLAAVRFPEDVHSAAEVFARADEVMSAVKAEGGNRAGSYAPTPGDREQQKNNLAIAGQVEQALREGRICFALQPVFQAGMRKPAYFETLLRLREPSGEILAAGAFIGVAEKCGLIRELDRWGLDEALAMLQADGDLELSLNLSGLTVLDPVWLRRLVSRVRNRPDLARRLILEITETIAMEDIDLTAHFIATVRELGCKVALDDFGSGHTSIRHMRSLAVDVVKIDSMFVRDMMETPENQMFIAKLVKAAQELGLDTVAEGIENENVALALEYEGVQYLQGWYFGKPQVAANAS